MKLQVDRLRTPSHVISYEFCEKTVLLQNISGRLFLNWYYLKSQLNTQSPFFNKNRQINTVYPRRAIECVWHHWNHFLFKMQFLRWPAISEIFKQFLLFSFSWESYHYNLSKRKHFLLRWFVGLKLIQVEQQKTQLRFIV